MAETIYDKLEIEFLGILLDTLCGILVKKIFKYEANFILQRNYSYKVLC